MDMRNVSAKDMSAEIISYADSNHYLLAMVSAGQQDAALVTDLDDKPMTFNSMDEAKDWLKGKGFTEACLRMETAYEEIVGEKTPAARLRIPLSH